MAKKRVLIFSTAYLPLIGGAEIAVKEITDRLGDVFEFVMITAKIRADLEDQEQIGNIFVHRVGRGDHWDKFRLIWSGWKKAQELGKFDVVWSIMASYGGFAALRFKKRNRNVPFLLTLQEGDSKWDIYKHVWWCWWYFKQIFKRADRIQAISTYLAKWANKLGANCPIEVVPNGVDLQKFQNNKSQINFKSQITKTLGVPENTKLIITASRLVKKNGVGALVQTMKFLPSENHLLIAGTGELEAELKQTSAELGLSERIHFLGNVSHEKLSEYMWASDVFCRPSLSEGLGNAFLEAMAAGLPIVGTPVGGIPDFLLNGETGLFCKPNDPASIAEQIKRLFADPALAERLRTQGQNLVIQKYSWKTVAERMGVLLNTAL